MESLGLASLLVLLGLANAGSTSLSNVVVIICDDMRPWPEFSSPSLAPPPPPLPPSHTPRMHEFFGEALRLSRAYAQISVCAPSRASFLTGR